MPLLICTTPKDLIHDNEFPTEVAEVLKWSCLVCSVPVAFNGVQTRVLVDAPGKSSGKYQQPSTDSREQFLPTLRHLFAYLSEMARALSRQNLWIRIFLDTESPPPPAPIGISGIDGMAQCGPDSPVVVVSFFLSGAPDGDGEVCS